MEILNTEKLTERFEKDFQKYLTPSNTFWMNTKGISNSANYTVNIPQYLTEIAANSDASALTLDVVEWREDNKTVTQSTFKTKAYQIDSVKEFFTEQDMRNDCLVAIKDFMDTKIGDFAAYKLASATSGNTVFTTGSATRTTEVLNSNATVKKIAKADIIAVKKLIGKSNMPGKWFCLLTSDAMADLFEIDDFVKADSTGNAQSALINGEIATLMGINFFLRDPKSGANVAYTNTTGSTVATKVDINAVVSTGITVTNDTVGGLIFWNENAAYKNQGLLDVNVSYKDAYHAADALSAVYTYGLEPIRSDYAGLIALVEKHV